MSQSMIIKVPSERSRVVAMKSVEDTSIVSHGNSIRTVLSEARKAGSEEPVLVFVPKPGHRYIY